ncbi:hypothetical protein FRC17_005112, partial [Serendipita sp. 399]
PDGFYSIRAQESYSNASSTICRLLDILAGMNGNLCARWKSLNISIKPDQIWFGPPHNAPYPMSLTHPMPSLTRLRLVGFRTGPGATLFPALPSIESIDLQHCSPNNYPDMSHAKEIHLDDVRPWSTRIAFYELPQKLPVLETLSVGGGMLTVNLEEVLMPHLERLIVDFKLVGLVSGLINLPILSQVRTLQLFGSKSSLIHRSDMAEPISDLLRACTSMCTLTINDFILSLLLGDWKNWGHLFEGEEKSNTTRVFLCEEGDMDRWLNLENEDTYVVLMHVATKHHVRLPDEFYGGSVL